MWSPGVPTTSVAPESQGSITGVGRPLQRSELLTQKRRELAWRSGSPGRQREQASPFDVGPTSAASRLQPLTRPSRRSRSTLLSSAHPRRHESDPGP